MNNLNKMYPSPSNFIAQTQLSAFLKKAVPNNILGVDPFFLQSMSMDGSVSYNS